MCQVRRTPAYLRGIRYRLSFTLGSTSVCYIIAAQRLIKRDVLVASTSYRRNHINPINAKTLVAVPVVSDLYDVIC